MQDEFANRLSMFRTSLNLLNSADWQTVWKNQSPVIFTTKVADAEQMVGELETLVRSQSTVSGGATERKAREEAELEDSAHLLGQLLSVFFRDHGDEASAANVDLTISVWRRLRNQELLEKARVVRDLANGIVTGPQSTAAANYGLSAAEVSALTKEIDDYAAVITAPQQSIAERKALTLQLRDRFAAVEEKFAVLDSLILRFNNTPDGQDLINAYNQARTTRDLGRRASQPASPPAPQPPAS